MTAKVLLSDLDLTVLRALAPGPLSRMTLRVMIMEAHPDLLNPGSVVQRLVETGLVDHQDLPFLRFSLSGKGEGVLRGENQQI